MPIYDTLVTANPICMNRRDSGKSANPNHVVRWHFSSLSWVCVPFVYFGEGGNDNNFESAADCAAQCPLDGEFLHEEAGDLHLIGDYLLKDKDNLASATVRLS